MPGDCSYFNRNYQYYQMYARRFNRVQTFFILKFFLNYNTFVDKYMVLRIIDNKTIVLTYWVEEIQPQSRRSSEKFKDHECKQPRLGRSLEIFQTAWKRHKMIFKDMILILKFPDILETSVNCCGTFMKILGTNKTKLKTETGVLWICYRYCTSPGIPASCQLRSLLRCHLKFWRRSRRNITCQISPIGIEAVVDI